MAKKEYYLIDLNRDDDIIKDRAYTTAAWIAIKYGEMGRAYRNLEANYIREFWNYDTDYPSIAYFIVHVKAKGVKWYIHNKITIKESIWNGDFLHGLASHGKIKWSKPKFPTLRWYLNKTILELLKSCPFAGGFCEKKEPYAWTFAPALYLKYSEDSLSFMAGVLAGGRIEVINGLSYARFPNKMKEFFNKWGIPIEYRVEYRNYICISPFWVALFTPMMPEFLKERWLNCKKPVEASLYAAILYRLYVDHNFASKKIPFLKCEKAIFNNFKCEEGAMKRLDKLRVEKNLTILDNRIREMVKLWAAQTK